MYIVCLGFVAVEIESDINFKFGAALFEIPVNFATLIYEISFSHIFAIFCIKYFSLYSFILIDFCAPFGKKAPKFILVVRAG